jgi:hypothetical protein
MNTTRSIGAASIALLAISGCSVFKEANFSSPSNYKDLSDYEKFGFSLTKELNQGEWDDGTKVVFTIPHGCSNYSGSYSCDFMAVIEDVRGRQGCINLYGGKSKDGSLSFRSDSDTSCRWIDGSSPF